MPTNIARAEADFLCSSSVAPTGVEYRSLQALGSATKKLLASRIDSHLDLPCPSVPFHYGLPSVEP